MLQPFRFRYLSIILIGLIAGVLVTSLAWLQFWTPLRAPRVLYLIIFWLGIICVIAYGFYLRIRHKFLSRLWIGLSIFTAIGLAYLFPDTLAPGCGGMPRVFAHWETQCETVCTTVCTWWVPLSDPECAAQPHQPWDVGCCWAYGEECHEECSSVWVDDPPTVDGAFNCSSPGNGGWCRGGASVDVTAEDPQSYPLTIYIDINGSIYSCSGTACSLPMADGTGTASFLAQAAGGGNLTSAVSSVTYLVDTQAPMLGISAPSIDGLNGWYISSPITVTGTATDNVSGVAWVDINGGGAAYTASIDGEYTLSISAADAAGNTAAGTAYLQIDTTPPGVGFSMPSPNGANGWYRSPITISPSASDATSGLADQVVSIDGSNWYSSVGISSDGTYTVFAAALDVAGNSASTSTTVQYVRLRPFWLLPCRPPMAPVGITLLPSP